MQSSLEIISADAPARASAKVRRHLLPFLVVCYFAAYLDRVNVGFAALTMNADLGIGPEAFGFTAGIFFLGYCLFEVPSNILLEKFGARRWIARIMMTWGAVSAAMAFVTSVEGLSIVRFLLGVAERLLSRHYFLPDVLGAGRRAGPYRDHIYGGHSDF